VPALSPLRHFLPPQKQLNPRFHKDTEEIARVSLLIILSIYYDVIRKIILTVTDLYNFFKSLSENKDETKEIRSRNQYHQQVISKIDKTNR